MGVFEGKKINGFSSPVCSGHGQSEELPRKESLGMERTTKDTEASAESVPNPNMVNHSNYLSVGYGGVEDGKTAENQENIPRQELKLPDSIPQF
jgi:hypothetical protein